MDPMRHHLWISLTPDDPWAIPALHHPPNAATSLWWIRLCQRCLVTSVGNA